LALLDGRLAINAGFLVGHSTIRRLVLGEAWQEQATPDQLRRMAEIVDESVRGGALGFSSSWGSVHGDHLGNKVPSRYADAHELVTLASVLRSHPGTQLGFIPPTVPIWSDEIIDMMIEMSVNAQSPLNWNLLTVRNAGDPGSKENHLGASDRAAKRGGEIIALSMPLASQFRLNLMTTIAYNSIPVWQEVLTLPFEERLRALVDPGTRRRMADAVAETRSTSDPTPLGFERMTVESVASPALKTLEGRVVGDIAAERGISALDAFLDVAVDDRLLACFRTRLTGNDDDERSWRQRAEYWEDPRVLVGGSDAGAHLDMLSTFAFHTDFIGPTVRDRAMLGLEEAVHKITDVPARLYGLRDRGRLQPGYHADLVVFDPSTVRTGDVVLRNDMPNNEYRLFADAVGMDHVVVNGVEIVDHGALTGDTPGTILRLGRDTTQRNRRFAADRDA
jgi:N-acyl-D-aspartate/D-glutamate deacylase